MLRIRYPCVHLLSTSLKASSSIFCSFFLNPKNFSVRTNASYTHIKHDFYVEITFLSVFRCYLYKYREDCIHTHLISKGTGVLFKTFNKLIESNKKILKICLATYTFMYDDNPNWKKREKK